MSDALLAQPRDIVHTSSNDAAGALFDEIGKVPTAANAWRTSNDIVDSWSRVATLIGFNQAR